MIEAKPQFQKRLATLGRKHTAMSQGYTTALRADGLIVVKPKRRARRGFPLKGLFGLVVGFFVFKAIMLASLGEITYNERVAKLNQGNSIEQGGAWVMQLEPVTIFLSGFLGAVIE